MKWAFFVDWTKNHFQAENLKFSFFSVWHQRISTFQLCPYQRVTHRSHLFLIFNVEISYQCVRHRGIVFMKARVISAAVEVVPHHDDDVNVTRSCSVHFCLYRLFSLSDKELLIFSWMAASQLQAREDFMSWWSEFVLIRKCSWWLTQKLTLPSVVWMIYI